MDEAKHFQCPFCQFAVTAGDEDEVVKHVMQHKQDRHPDVGVGEEDVRKMTKDVEVAAPPRSA